MLDESLGILMYNSIKLFTLRFSLLILMMYLIISTYYFIYWQLGGKNSKCSKLKSLAATKSHLINISKMNGYIASKKTGSIVCQISNAYKEFVEKNWSYLKTLIDIIFGKTRNCIPWKFWG